MYDSITRRLREQKTKREPERMYPGGTPYFNEQTGQYLPGGRMYPGGNPNFNERARQFTSPGQSTTQPAIPNAPGVQTEQTAARNPAERLQQYSGDYSNMGFDQLLQLLARYRMRGGF